MTTVCTAPPLAVVEGTVPDAIHEFGLLQVASKVKGLSPELFTSRVSSGTGLLLELSELATETLLPEARPTVPDTFVMPCAGWARGCE